MPPIKKYDSYFPQVPATSEQRLLLTQIANIQGCSVTDVLRDAWEEYCKSEEIITLLRRTHTDENITR